MTCLTSSEQARSAVGYLLKKKQLQIFSNTTSIVLGNLKLDANLFIMDFRHSLMEAQLLKLWWTGD